MNFIKKISFLLSSVFLFLMISCSNSFSNSTDISLCFNVSQLYNKTSEISRNDILLNNNQVFSGKLNVAIFQIKDVNAPESYVDFDKTKFKKITSSSGDIEIDGTVSVVLNEVPVGVKAFIVAELFNEQNGDLELIYAGLSNTFEVTEGTNIVELELGCIVEEITYKLTFVLGDGAAWSEDYIAPNLYSEEDASEIELPNSTSISKDGFIFEGWYDNDQYTVTAITSLKGRTGDLTLYAKWRSVDQVATVQFSEPAGGVDASTNITLTCATDNATIYYNFENKPFIDSSQSDSWMQYTSDATATGGGITIFADVTTNQNPVTIYAIAVCENMQNSDVATITYTLNEYTINLDANGGNLGSNVTSPITVKSGNTVSLLGYTATRTGYTFKDWYENDNPDFATSGGFPEFTPSRDNTTNKSKTFYAGWEPISYTVEFNGNGEDASSSMASQKFKYDESKALSQNTFTRTGYTFTGWNTKADGIGTTYADKAEVSNLTYIDGGIFILYAQWQPNTASINVTLPEYNEVNNLFSVTNKSDSQVTFTPINGYKHYIWYVNDTEKIQNTSNIDFTISSESYSGGVHTVMLVVEDNNGNYYSQEAIVEITK